MRSLCVFVLLVSLGGCASMVRSGAIMRAQDNYMDGDYQDAIEIVDRSLTSYDYDDEGKAQLLLVKAQSYEKLNELDAALGTYLYIVEQLPNTQVAYVLKRKLRAKSLIGPGI